jgi:hypothetical protein
VAACFSGEFMSASLPAIAEIDCARSALRGDGRQPLPDEVLCSPVPLVLRGLVAHWPLVQAAQRSARAADSYLRRFYRGATVHRQSSPAGQ